MFALHVKGDILISYGTNNQPRKHIEPCWRNQLIKKPELTTPAFSIYFGQSQEPLALSLIYPSAFEVTYHSTLQIQHLEFPLKL